MIRFILIVPVCVTFMTGPKGGCKEKIPYLVFINMYLKKIKKDKIS